MATDLHLIGYRYNIILSIFFILYMVYVSLACPLSAACRC